MFLQYHIRITTRRNLIISVNSSVGSHLRFQLSNQVSKRKHSAEESARKVEGLDTTTVISI